MLAQLKSMGPMADGFTKTLHKKVWMLECLSYPSHQRTTNSR